MFASIYFYVTFFTLNFTNNKQKQYLVFIKHQTLVLAYSGTQYFPFHIFPNIILCSILSFSLCVSHLFLASFLSSCMTLPTFSSRFFHISPLLQILGISCMRSFSISITGFTFYPSTIIFQTSFLSLFGKCKPYTL